MFANTHLIRICTLAILILLSSGVFRYFPSFDSVLEIWRVTIVALFFFLVFLKQRLLDGIRFTSFELYTILLTLYMMLASAIAAYFEFGQPLTYGLLQQRIVATQLFCLLLIYWVRAGLFNLYLIERALKVVLWTCLLLFIAMDLFGSPSSIGGIPGFVVGGGIGSPYAFNFNSAFIVFGAIYYFIKALYQPNIVNYILLLPLLYFLVFVDGGRSQLLSLAGVLALIIYSRVSFTAMFLWSIPALLALSIFSYLLMQYMGEEILQIQDDVYQALYVVVTGEESKDVSANARIEETNIAIPYIKERWLLGNGSLSAQWNGGWDLNVGRFRPSDIGLIGNFFIFGILGTLVVYFQFVYAIRHLRANTFCREFVVIQASKYYLLQIFVQSLATGGLIYYGSISLMFITIVYIGVLESNAYRAISDDSILGEK